jgi:hypothetical protein
MVFAKLSLRLSLSNPSNIWHCSKEICHKTTERERDKKEKKRKRANELDAKWYGKCRKQSTTGWISLIGFVRSVNVLGLHQVYIMNCRVWSQVFAFGGAITLQCFMRISDKKLLQYYSGLQPFWPWLMYIDNIDIPDSELLPPNWIATWFFWFELVRSGELHVDTWSKKKTGHDWPREYGWDVFGYLARVLIYGNRGACDTRTSINFVVINIFGWSSSILVELEYTIPGPNPHVICNWDLPVTYLAVQPLGLR